MGYTGDKVLEALETAEEVWERCVLADKQEKMGYAAKLYRYEHFSIPQIAKIVRLASRYLYVEFQPNADKGGRFDPATLSTLAKIRRLHVQGRRVPDALVRIGVQGGTSYTCLTVLTRIPYSAYYEAGREAQESK